jgi:hypothetical protein
MFPCERGVVNAKRAAAPLVGEVRCAFWKHGRAGGNANRLVADHESLLNSFQVNPYSEQSGFAADSEQATCLLGARKRKSV